MYVPLVLVVIYEYMFNTYSPVCTAVLPIGLNNYKRLAGGIAVVRSLRSYWRRCWGVELFFDWATGQAAHGQKKRIGNRARTCAKQCATIAKPKMWQSGRIVRLARGHNRSHLFPWKNPWFALSIPTMLTKFRCPRHGLFFCKETNQTQMMRWLSTAWRVEDREDVYSPLILHEEVPPRPPPLQSVSSRQDNAEFVHRHFSVLRLQWARILFFLKWRYFPCSCRVCKSLSKNAAFNDREYKQEAWSENAVLNDE